MKIVGMMSTYKEGALSKAACESILRCGLDDLLVYEGPAGDPIEGDIPDSEFPHEMWDTLSRKKFPVDVHLGRWRTDGRKRDAMLQEAKRRHPEPGVWAVVVDGDEVLMNGEYLRDRLQALAWDDEHTADPDHQPWARFPLRIVEADGAMAMVGGRVFRLDLVKQIRHSTSVVENVNGVVDGWGNVAENSEVWIRHFLGAVDRGRMTAWPPLPCEPYLVHRSNLRHPLRRQSRLHAQETAELKKAGILE